jgi:hypothetical protein
MKTRMTACHCLRAAILVTGLVLRSLPILQAADGLKWEVSNKTGFFSPFSYQSA